MFRALEVCAADNIHRSPAQRCACVSFPGESDIPYVHSFYCAHTLTFPSGPHVYLKRAHLLYCTNKGSHKASSASGCQRNAPRPANITSTRPAPVQNLVPGIAGSTPAFNRVPVVVPDLAPAPCLPDGLAGSRPGRPDLESPAAADSRRDLGPAPASLPQAGQRGLPRAGPQPRSEARHQHPFRPRMPARPTNPSLRCGRRGHREPRGPLTADARLRRAHGAGAKPQRSLRRERVAVPQAGAALRR